MRIDIITCLPEILKGPLDTSIIGRAQKKSKVNICIHNLRDYSTDKHKKVDDYPYGGGGGMVLSIEPIVNCIEHLQKKINYDEIIYTSPDGEILNQNIANNLSLKKKILILCGHYKGIDERVRENFVTREISIGEYVLSGGELASAVLVDAVVRLLPGVLSNVSSALTDTFQDGLVGCSEYTRPYNFRGLKVPEVLLSGDFEKISAWRQKCSLDKTQKRNRFL